MNITKYSKHLSELWFTLINLGLKTVDVRKNKGKFKEMKNFNKNYRKSIIFRNGGLGKCLPCIPSLEHGLSVYSLF